MLSISRHSVQKMTAFRARLLLLSPLQRYKSTYAENSIDEITTPSSSSSGAACHPYVFPFDEDGNAEVINFPAVDRNSPTYNTDTKPILLNSKEHAVGYLSRILNARVYEAAIETDLQHAKNLSAVSNVLLFVFVLLFLSRKISSSLLYTFCFCIGYNLNHFRCLPKRTTQHNSTHTIQHSTSRIQFFSSVKIHNPSFRLKYVVRTTKWLI